MPSQLGRDKRFDHLVVIPTCADPAVLIPSLQRHLIHADGTRTRFVLAVNSEQPSREADVVDAVARLKVPEGCAVDVVLLGGPKGFGGAVNAGLQWATDNGGLPAMSVIINDDVDVTAGWLPGLAAALSTETVRACGDPSAIDRPVAGYGRIGLVGPVSDNVAGIQRIPLQPEHMRGGLDAFAAQYRQPNVGNYVCADFLSGFCIALSADALDDLVLRQTGADGVERVRLFDDTTFPIGGFEDNDLMVRAELAGWRCALAGDIFVHHKAHQTLDRLFPGQQRGLANRLRYYERWRSITVDADLRVAAVYRVKIEVANDVSMLRASLSKIGTLVDGVAVLLTGNPGGILDAPDLGSADVSPADKRMAERCRAARSPEAACDAFREWATRCLAMLPGARKVEVVVSAWAKAEWNERDERNAAIHLAEGLAPTWLLSVDHDEVFEDRIERRHLERWASHPDPMVRSLDFGWLNHWDSDRLVRQDSPWGDGGAYRGGMRGFRMWRASPAMSREIIAGNEIGLHCGNAPDHDPIAKRVTGGRFRHFGYLRPWDRQRKHTRYTRLDPNPRSELTGGGYGHLVREEGMRLSPYVATDGIGVHVLLHEGESVEDVARWLDQVHCLVDRVVLVWTGDWADEDHPARFPHRPGLDEPAPATGPTPEFWRLAALFGCEFVHHRLDDDLAAARNAGIDALLELQRTEEPGLGWAWFFDPDEHLQDTFGDVVAVRRMAEVSDSYGWLFRFVNLIRGQLGEGQAPSENVRMSRLDPKMRMDSRVHEGFGDAITALQREGIHPTLRYAPFIVRHVGLAGSDDDVERKIRRYQRMLLLEVQDRPWNPGAWTSLGLQYMNDGHIELAEQCFQRGVLVAGTSYLPWKELAMSKLREVVGILNQVVRLTADAHPYHQVASNMVQWINQNAPPQPKIGRARVGLPTGEPPPVPDLPVEAVERAREMSPDNPSPRR